MNSPALRNQRNRNGDAPRRIVPVETPANTLVVQDGIVLVFKQGDDPIDAINKMMSFLSTVVTSRFPSTNNQLRNSSNPRQQATIHDGRVTVHPVQGRKVYLLLCLKPKRKRDATWFRDKVLLVEAHGSSRVLNEEELAFLANPGVAEAKAVLMANLSSYGSDVLSEVPHSENTYNDMLNQSVQELPYSEQTHLVNYSENKITSDSNIIPYSQPMLYDGTVIAKETNVISIADSKETLMLEEESRSKMLLKQKLSDEQDFWLQTSLLNTDQSASLPVKIKAPRELPKVSLVNRSLKNLKYHLGQFDTVVKKRTTPDALTEGKWGFEHTKTVFLKEIIPFLKTLKDIFNVFDKDLLNEKHIVIENDQFLDQIISQDIVNIVVNSSVDMNTSVNVNYSVSMNDSVNYVESATSV
ncbi:hypothetical protein Tco_0406973 [Tanacetum coccineum]